MRSILVLALLLVPGVAMAQPGEEQVSERLSRLNIMFDGNLSGAAWVKHCGEAPITEYPNYIENAQATMLALAEEMMSMGMGLTPAQIEQVIRKKQADQEKALNAFYLKNGCESSQAAAAKKHFDMFNAMDMVKMQDFLGDIENR